VAEVAVVHARQRAVGAGAGDEGVGLGAQRCRRLAAEGPAELQLARQLQQRHQLRMEVDAEVEMDVVHRDQFGLALGHARQQSIS
jgi:hypothetical protein